MILNSEISWFCFDFPKTWFVYFLVCFGDNQLIPRGGLAVIVNEINNLATQSWKTMLALAS
jgi:hypothetical protein